MATVVATIGPDREELELELRDDAEVAAAAAQAPEQVGCSSALARTTRPSAVTTVAAERVAAEAVLAPEPAEAAAQREPGDARVRDDATGRREPVSLRRGVEVPPAGTGADGGAAPLRVHRHGRHRRQVDHQRAVADGEAGDVVAAAPDRDGQALRPGERDGRDHLVRRLDPRDHGRTVVDHAVPDLAGVVVAGVARTDQALGGDGRGGAGGRGASIGSPVRAGHRGSCDPPREQYRLVGTVRSDGPASTRHLIEMPTDRSVC